MSDNDNEFPVQFGEEYIHRDYGRLIPVCATVGWATQPTEDSEVRIVIVSHSPDNSNLGPYVFTDLSEFEVFCDQSDE